MLRAVRKAHLLQRLHGKHPALFQPDALINQGQLYIFQHAEILHQIILLKNKPDLLVADVAELLVAQLPHVHPIQQVVSPGGDVQTAQHVHHGGLSRAGLTHDGHKLPPLNVKGNSVQRPDLALKALSIDFINFL
ncbi:hypothetical protein SDC9_143797 [bioreactor metagenome]|uniref:Uncharacterized protein n=1 Tax=bioreactor metagenome TaxID=1076179 RepID=A0A645E7N9_9ZZZZ